MVAKPKNKQGSSLNDEYKRAILERMQAKKEPPNGAVSEHGPRGKKAVHISVELVQERIKSIATKRMQDELYLAKAREELIEKRLVEKQAAYLLVSLRQRILALPNTYARRFLGLADAKQSAALLRELALGLLNEIRSLPEKVVDPNWLRTLEEEETKDDANTR